MSELEDLKRAVVLLASNAAGMPPRMRDGIIEMLGDVPEVKRIPKAGEKWWYNTVEVIITLRDKKDWYHIIHLADGSVDDVAEIGDFDEFICDVDLSFLTGGEDE